MIVLCTPDAQTINLLFFQSRDFFALNTFFLLFLSLWAFHSRKLNFVFHISIQLLSEVDCNECCLSTIREILIFYGVNSVVISQTYRSSLY